MLAPCSAPSRLNERRYAPALTAPARVAGDDGQAGMKERLPARTKELDDEALTTEEPRPGLREETERWRSVFPARANTGDPNGPTRGRSANQIARALISMMARSNQLQSEAGYIDARPLSQIDDPSCDARPDHTKGSLAAFSDCPMGTDLPPVADLQTLDDRADAAVRRCLLMECCIDVDVRRQSRHQDVCKCIASSKASNVVLTGRVGRFEIVFGSIARARSPA
jgi:hypothetical protein